MALSDLMTLMAFSTPFGIGVRAGYLMGGTRSVLIGLAVGAACGTAGIAMTRGLVKLGTATVGRGKQGGTLPSLWDMLAWLVVAAWLVGLIGLGAASTFAVEALG
jgi:hypothetical protein